MSIQDRYIEQMANEMLRLRNTILITLPSCNLPDEANNFSLERSMQLIKLTAERKSRIKQDSQKIFIAGKRTFASDFESIGWAIELTYKESFSFIEYIDFREDRVMNLINTLLTLVTIDWEKVWIIFTLKKQDPKNWSWFIHYLPLGFLKRSTSLYLRNRKIFV